MQRLAALFMIGAGLAAQPASAALAAPAPANTMMTCRDFLSYDEVTRPRLIYWAQGVKTTGQPRDAVVDIADTERLVPIVTEECSAAPQSSFWQQLDASWMKAKADVKRHL
jgi:hypothetical protein